MPMANYSKNEGREGAPAGKGQQDVPTRQGGQPRKGARHRTAEFICRKGWRRGSGCTCCRCPPCKGRCFRGRESLE